MTRLRMLRAAVWLSWGVVAAAAVARVVAALAGYAEPAFFLASGIAGAVAVLAVPALKILVQREEELVDYLMLREVETNDEFTAVSESLQARLTRARTMSKVTLVVGALIVVSSIVLSGYGLAEFAFVGLGSVLLANGVMGLVMVPATRPPEAASD